MNINKLRSKTYSIKQFRSMASARKVQQDTKKDYGYKPDIIRVSKDGNSILVIVKPKGLKKI